MKLFGCDGVLLSGKVQDECGVCGGDGSSCTLTSDTFIGGRAKGIKKQQIIHTVEIISSNSIN